MRAVQVDWIKLRSTNELSLHAKVIRSQILILYLLSDSNDYERTFGQRALSSYLAQFWKDYHYHVESDDSVVAIVDSGALALVDEMLLYSTLFQLQQDICSKATAAYCENDIVIGQSALETYRSLQEQQRRQHSTNDFALFQWALQLFNECCLGHWHSLLHHLALPSALSSPISILVKCIMAPALAKIRWKALQAYNVSWTTGEKVTTTDFVKVLQFPTPAEALNFAQTFGLPTEKVPRLKDDSTNVMEDVIIFKTVPIKLQPSSSNAVTNRQDNFVVAPGQEQNTVNKTQWK